MPDPRGIDPNKLLLAAAIGLLICLAAGMVFAQALPAGARLDPQEALEVSQRAVGKSIGDYVLTDVERGPVRLADYRGKPLLLSFVYTGCFQVCPAATQFLNRAVNEAQRALGRDEFNVVTIGFNLPFDTPVAMREFRKRHRVGAANWAFLAGDAATISRLASDVGFQWVPSATGFDHVTQLSVIDGRGRLVRQVYGESFELPMLIAPLKELVTGAPAPVQDLAGLLDRVRLLCTVYDARSGRYRLDYGLFIEIFAGLSILGAILAYLVREWRAQRPRRVP